MITNESQALDSLKLARSHLEDVATYYKSTLFLYEDNDHAWAAGVALDWVNNALGYASTRRDNAPAEHIVSTIHDCGPLCEAHGDVRDTSISPQSANESPAHIAGADEPVAAPQSHPNT